MAYIGNIPAEAYTNTVKDSFNGTGSATAFTLSQPTVTNDVRVVVENVVQDPTVAYSVSGTTLTFTSAPPSGTANIYVVHLGAAVMTAIPPSEIADATTFASSVTVQGAFTSLGIDDNANATAITIDSSENVLVGASAVGMGTSSSVTGAAIRGSIGYFEIARDGDSAARLNRQSSNGSILDFAKDGSTVGSIGTQYGYLGIGTQNTGVYFHPTVPAVVPCDPSSAFVNRDNAIDIGVSNVRFKDLYLSGGVYLGGTGAANKLSDVETGTFTPIWNGYTPYGTSGKYVKIGTQVTVYATLITNAATDGSLIKLNNLPFQIAGDQGGGIIYHNTTGLYAYNIYTLFTANSTICELKTVSGGVEVGVAYVSSAPSMGGYSTLRWTLVYTTAS